MTKEPRITVEWWVERSIKWLLKVEDEPDLLPRGKNAWEVLEADFRKNFEDYCGREMAVIKLQELQMKQGHVDDYIAEFEYLAHRTDYGLYEPYTVHLFTCGLPHQLANACIAHERPEYFDQWTSAVRYRDAIWQQRKQVKN
jgi:hypothetical protein